MVAGYLTDPDIFTKVTIQLETDIRQMDRATYDQNNRLEAAKKMLNKWADATQFMDDEAKLTLINVLRFVLPGEEFAKLRNELSAAG